MNITQGMTWVLAGVIALGHVLFAGVPTGTVTQDVPGQISYQGVLANPVTGQYYSDGVYTLDIRIWNSETRKTGCLWGAKYRVSVKNGYFSVMLGDPSAQNFEVTDGEQPQYAKDELWKALWGENAEDATRYLGITPHEDARCAPVSVLAEISPRHQLLAAPFAFRAEKAQYAEESEEDFTVDGKLTVEGNATFSAGLNAPSTAVTQQFGPIKTSSADVQVGGAATPTAGNPNVYEVGNLLTFNAYGNLSLETRAADMVFSIPNGRNLKAQGAGSLALAAAANTIGGTGETTLKGGKLVAQCQNIRYEQTGTDVTVSGGNDLTIGTPKVQMECTSANAVTFKGRNAARLSTDEKQILQANGNWIGGSGAFRWDQDGSISAPIVIRKVEVTMDKSEHQQIFTGLLSKNELKRYKWGVRAWQSSNGYVISGLMMNDDGGLRVEKHSDYTGKSFTVYVWLIGYARDWM